MEAARPSLMQVITNSGKNHPEFTKHDIDMLTWLAAGKRYEEIAVLLHCKVSTSRQRMYRIMRKLKVRTSAGAVALALRKGIIA